MVRTWQPPGGTVSSPFTGIWKIIFWHRRVQRKSRCLAQTEFVLFWKTWCHFFYCQRYLSTSLIKQFQQRTGSPQMFEVALSLIFTDFMNPLNSTGLQMQYDDICSWCNLARVSRWKYCIAKYKTEARAKGRRIKNMIQKDHIKDLFL